MCPARWQTPWWIEGVQRSILGGFQSILLIFDKFLPIFSEKFHPKVLGHIYLSRRVYLALYGIQVWITKRHMFYLICKLDSNLKQL